MDGDKEIDHQEFLLAKLYNRNREGTIITITITITTTTTTIIITTDQIDNQKDKINNLHTNNQNSILKNLKEMSKYKESNQLLQDLNKLNSLLHHLILHLHLRLQLPLNLRLCLKKQSKMAHTHVSSHSHKTANNLTSMPWKMISSYMSIIVSGYPLIKVPLKLRKDRTDMLGNRKLMFWKTVLWLKDWH